MSRENSGALNGSGVTSITALRELVASMRPDPATREPLVAAPDSVILYDHRLLERFIQGNKEVDGKQRRKEIAMRLKEMGPQRKLGAWPSEGMQEALEALRRSHPNFEAVMDYVIGEVILAGARGRAVTNFRVLFTGPAGVGKTDFALQLGKALGLPVSVTSMSSAQSSAAIGGSDEYWSNSRPGVVFEELTEGQFANPLFLLDEIDKIPARYGEAVGALYQLFEQHTAKVFADRSVPFVPIDASHVNWLATANYIQDIEPALLSRFRVFEISLPTRAQQRNLVQRLYRLMLEALDMADRFPPEIKAGSVELLVQYSARETKAHLHAALLRAVSAGATELTIRKQDLNKPTGQVEARPMGFIWPAEKGAKNASNA